MICWRRVAACTGKELRELRLMTAVFALLGAAAVTCGIALRQATFFTPSAALLDLLVVAALHAGLLAERQGADVGKATRRHLLSFPLQPLEVVAGKGFAFLLAQVTLVLVGIAAYAGAARFLTDIRPEPAGLAFAACRILLFSIPCWSTELAVVSWPRVGPATVLSLIAAYALGLVLLPPLRGMFNIAHLLLLWIDDLPLLGPGLAAALLAWAGIMTTAWAVTVRPVEE